jgi:hypothetical protein
MMKTWNRTFLAIIVKQRTHMTLTGNPIKADNFSGPLSGSDSGFVPLSYSRDGNARPRCGFIAYSTKAGVGNDTHLMSSEARFEASDVRDMTG